MRLPSRPLRLVSVLGALSLWLAPSALAATPAGTLGYYRFPTLHDDTVVFTAEGDLWSVPLEGGIARRLTSHLGEETFAELSPDGGRIAFSATYEGPTEVYVMSAAGGVPKRLTWEGVRANVVGWSPQGEVLYASRRGSGLPAGQLFAVDASTGARRALPLAQAAEGLFDGSTLYFTRQESNISNTRRYRGGTIQQLWRWDGRSEERRVGKECRL